MVRRTTAVIAIAMSLSLILAACAPNNAPAVGDPPTSVFGGTIESAQPVVVSTGPASPNFRLLVSDEPNDMADFATLYVLVSGVGAEGGDGVGVVEDWFEPVQLDLTPLVDDKAVFLWEGHIPDGTYNKVFLYVDATYGILEGAGEGETVEVKLPSNKLHVNAPVTISSDDGGKIVEFVFDISVHKAGNSGMYILSPQASESGVGREYQLVNHEEAGIKTGRPEWAGKPEAQGTDDDLEGEEDDDQDDANPSIDVEKRAEAVEGAVASFVTITNTSDDDVTVKSVIDTVYWQVRGGNWQELATNIDEETHVIAAGESVTLEYEIPCDVPAEARELRNKVEVQIDGRDKVFRDIVSFDPYGYMPEIEFEGEVVGADPLTVLSDEGSTYTVLIDDNTEIEGRIVEGEYLKVEGLLHPDGTTVTALEIEGTEDEDDSEIELQGSIEGTDPLLVTTDEGTYQIVIKPETEVEGDLVLGASVKVEGVLQADGTTVIADEVEVEEQDE
ncbi:MAG: DUF4382 domain-containing protein [Dehalococcoidia bacterium]|nr:DUF4382 domain-containing protein [Dehalococcoidia bacterium]